jgi:hypothetical protein
MFGNNPFIFDPQYWSAFPPCLAACMIVSNTFIAYQESALQLTVPDIWRMPPARL